MLHGSCNIGTTEFPDMYVCPQGLFAYISGKSLVPMLQLHITYMCAYVRMYVSKYVCVYVCTHVCVNVCILCVYVYVCINVYLQEAWYYNLCNETKLVYWANFQ